MTIEGALIARAAAVSGLNTLITGRIYAVKLPQAPTLPAVVFTRIGEQFEHAMGSDPGRHHCLFQFDSWDKTFEGARALADQVRAAFNRYRGTGDSTVVEDILVENEHDFFDDETKDWHVATDMMVHYDG